MINETTKIMTSAFDGQKNVPVLLKTSWEGQFAHVVREHGKMRRCKIGQLSLSQGEVAMEVIFREYYPQTKKIEWLTKTVSPLLLLLTNEHWKMATAVSEKDENDDEECKGRDFVEYKDASLPLFTVDAKDVALLNEAEVRKLNWMVRQVQNAQELSQFILPY